MKTYPVKQQYPVRDFDRPHRTVPWKKSPVYFVNPRGVLTHRLRFGITHFRHGRFSHHGRGYWCGGGGPTDGVYTNSPPTDRLLCKVCEDKAVAAGQPSSEELTGRHVCVGGIKPVRMCCKNEDN